MSGFAYFTLTNHTLSTCPWWRYVVLKKRTWGTPETYMDIKCLKIGAALKKETPKSENYYSSCANI